jgi:hypothetical protein
VIAYELLGHAIVGHYLDELGRRAGSEHGNGGMGGQGRHLHSVIDSSDRRCQAQVQKFDAPHHATGDDLRANVRVAINGIRNFRSQNVEN